MRVTPLIISRVDWGSLGSSPHGLNEDPLRLLSLAEIDKDDPVALAYLYDDLDLAYVGFMFESSYATSKLLVSEGLDVTVINNSVICAGSVQKWLGAIQVLSLPRNGQEAQQIAREIVGVLERTKLTKLVRFDKTEKGIKSVYV